MSIAYQALAVQSSGSYSYNVKLLYGDQANNQLVSDPFNCLDWRVYQTNNAFNIDSSRKYSGAEGSVPSWPKASYSFNQQASAGQLDFSLSQDDLDSR